MKNIILQLIVLLFLVSCTFPVNKEKLVIELVDMRIIPSKLVQVIKIGDYEIAYQDKSTYSDRYHYPNNYAIGKVNTQKNDYKYVTHVNGISAVEEFKYITTILETFATDSTYVSVILKEEESVKVNIYRKTKESKSKFVMWKKIQSPYKTVIFETVELVNMHRFKN